VLVALAVIWVWLGPAVDRARAQELADDVFSAVLRLTSEIPPEARTANALGTRREGSGIAIDDNGLVLTIGYLMLEAMSVTVYDASSKPVPADILAHSNPWASSRCAWGPRHPSRSGIGRWSSTITGRGARKVSSWFHDASSPDTGST
jgi:hypothetical protein